MQTYSLLPRSVGLAWLFAAMRVSEWPLAGFASVATPVARCAGAPSGRSPRLAAVRLTGEFVLEGLSQREFVGGVSEHSEEGAGLVRADGNVCAGAVDRKSDPFRQCAVP